MSDNTENYFYRNRNHQTQELYFREWLPNVYLPSVKVLRKANLNVAEAQYHHELEKGIEFCNRSSLRNKRKLEDILLQFDTMPKLQRQKIYKDAWGVEKEKHQSEEQEQNLIIIQNNINFIMGGCNAKIHGECSKESLSVYTELFNILQHLDLGTIEPEIPIASGKRNKFYQGIHSVIMNFPTKLDEFVSSYSELRTDFDLALMLPISFPHGEMTLGTRRILITTFDLLEGLRRIWSCRPLLTEEDYSENSYVIHATSKSSQCRKNQMGSINLGKKPDLQVLLKLDMKANELDCFDERYNIFFENREDTSSGARLIHCELEKIPILEIQVIGECIFVSLLDLFEGVFYRVYRICEITIPLRISTHQVVEEFLRGSLKLRAIVIEIVGMLVSIKDEINLLPACEERTPSTSMMSTTYSPPRNS
ncbi:9705_t:CDS:2 [Dentiscutata heterogama]|uniref:9705_t:CDS:1 n=1 Tax=Dentiscutata heterogama TaxID=1316150 RepID=A0ACA9KYR9_9GLOM|nr:9705_t:CDS:2 [Dentiscutata heterogama]